jgi:hypothetical protein
MRKTNSQINAPQQIGFAILTKLIGGRTRQSMRFHHIRALCILMLFLLGLWGSAIGQQSSGTVRSAAALTNQDIILMTRSKFDDATIIKTIQSFDTTFDLSVPALMKLKDAAVTQTVIQAMLGKATNANKAGQPEVPSTSVTTVTPISANLLEEVGVFVNRQGTIVAMEPEIVNWRTGGVLKTMATAGLDKGHVNGFIAGPHSNLKLTSPSFMSPEVLEFYFHCAEGGSATEYQLLHFWEKSDRREFRAVTGGVLHASGGAKDNVSPFEYEKVAPRIYKIKVPRLSVGEYGFLAPGAVASANAASQGTIYTFQIVE